MTTTAQLLTSSQRYRPRQFEFHPKNDSLIFGTLTGSIYHISDVTSDERRAINPLGRFNLPNANAYPDDYQNQLHVFDAILGLCWFRNHNHRFISGSQRGILLCGDIRDNGNAEHSIDMAEGSSSSGASSISAQLPTGSPSSYSSSSSSSSSSYLSNNIVKKYETFEKLTSVHLNCDDSYCIVSGYRQDVSLYDVETGEIISTYENAHADNINISRFANISPNIFCTSSFDAKLWDVRQKPAKPVYSIKCSSGLVMVSFSPSDVFLLTSALDNEVSQHLVVDGRTACSFAIPKTGLAGNFTRAYYSASASYIFTGACEEKCVNVLCASTGQRLGSVDIYPHRHHSSLYIQSLRGSPLWDRQLAVLCNYKDIGDREIVLINLPQNDAFDNDIYDLSSSERVHPNPSPNPIGSMLAPPLASPLLLPSPHLEANLSALRSRCVLTSSSVDGVSLAAFDARKIDAVAACGLDPADLRVRELDLCAYIGGGAIVAMHAFIALCRSHYLCSQVTSALKKGLTDASPLVIDISRAVNVDDLAIYTIPIVLDFLYTGAVTMKHIKQQCLGAIHSRHCIDRPSQQAMNQLCRPAADHVWSSGIVLARALVSFFGALYSAASSLELHRLGALLDRLLFSLVSPATVLAVNQVSTSHGRSRLHSATIHYMRNHFDIVSNIHQHAGSAFHALHHCDATGGGASLAELALQSREEYALEFDSPAASDAGDGVRGFPSEEEVDAEECWSFRGLIGLRYPVPKLSGHVLIGALGDSLLLLGGQNGQRNVDPRHMQLFNTATLTWSPVSCGGEVPELLMYATAGSLQREQQRHIILLGGHRGREHNLKPALYVLDLMTMAWSSPEVGSFSLGASRALCRYRHCSVGLLGGDVDLSSVWRDQRAEALEQQVLRLGGAVPQRLPSGSGGGGSGSCYNEWLVGEEATLITGAALERALHSAYSSPCPAPHNGTLVASFVLLGGVVLSTGSGGRPEPIVTLVCRESSGVVRSAEGAVLSSSSDSFVWTAIVPQIHDSRQADGASSLLRAVSRIDHAAALLPRGFADGGCRMVVAGGMSEDAFHMPKELLSVRCSNPFELVVEKVVVHGRGGPLPRCCHSMTRVPAQDVIVLHGGLSRVDGGHFTARERLMGDTWLLRVLSCSLAGLEAQWEQVTVLGVPLSPRCRHQVVAADRLLYFSGGVERARWTDPRSPPTKDVDPLVKVMEIGSDTTKWRWVRVGNRVVCVDGDPVLSVEPSRLHRDLLSLLLADNRKGRSGLRPSALRHTMPLLAIGAGGDESSFRVVRQLITARSQMFRAMLHEQRFSEAARHAIEIHGYDVEVVVAFLAYLYSDIVRVDMQNVTSLLEIGQLYGCDQLEQLCHGYLLRQVSIDNACSLLQYAERYGLETLKLLCFVELLRGLSSVAAAEVTAAVREELSSLPPPLLAEVRRFCCEQHHAYSLDAPLGWEEGG